MLGDSVDVAFFPVWLLNSLNKTNVKVHEVNSVSLKAVSLC